jgi:hypothetical protein
MPGIQFQPGMGLTRTAPHAAPEFGRDVHRGSRTFSLTPTVSFPNKVQQDNVYTLKIDMPMDPAMVYDERNTIKACIDTVDYKMVREKPRQDMTVATNSETGQRSLTAEFDLIPKKLGTGNIYIGYEQYGDTIGGNVVTSRIFNRLA